MTQAALVCREAEHTDKLGARSQMSIMGTYNCDPRGPFGRTGPREQCCSSFPHRMTYTESRLPDARQESAHAWKNPWLQGSALGTSPPPNAASTTLHQRRRVELCSTAELSDQPASRCVLGQEPACRGMRKCSNASGQKRECWLITGLFILHSCESEFSVTGIHNFKLGSAFKFKHSIRINLDVSLLSLALYEEATRPMWEEGHLKFRRLKSGRS